MQMMMKTALVVMGLAASAVAFSPQTPPRISPPKSQSSLSVVIDDNLLAAGAAVAAAVAGMAAMGGEEGAGGAKSLAANKKSGGSAAAKEEKIDVSIPYSAAAMLEYDSLRGKGKDFSKSAFAKFEKLYNDKAVAIVVSKKVARDHATEMKAMETKISNIEKEMAEVASA